MLITVKIKYCHQCHYVDHSGAFTPGGAKPICQHPDVIEIVAKFKDIECPPDYIKHLNNEKSPLHKKAVNYIHWKHRVIRSKTIPEWCPLKHGGSY